MGQELQIFTLSKNLFFANDIANIETIGNQIYTLLENIDLPSDNMIELVNHYLYMVNKRMEEIDLQINIFHLAYAMLNIHIKKHKILTTQMTHFYTLHHIKELSLSSHCKEVRFSTMDDSFGNYQASTKCLTLHPNYIEKR